MFKTLVVAPLMFLALIFVPGGNASAELYMNISGRVLETASSSGIENATVVLLSEMAEKIGEARTDSRGNFLLRSIPKGTYRLNVNTDDPYIMNLSQPYPLTVSAGKNVVGIPLRLQRGCAIQGKVLTSSGYAVQQTDLIANASASATTNNEGFFLLKGVAPGIANIDIIPPVIGTRTITANCEANKTIDIGSVALNVGMETIIQGKLVDAAGSPLAGAIISASNANNNSKGYTVSAANGRFFFAGLDSGSYELNIMKVGYKPLKLAGVTVPTTGLTIILQPTTTATLELPKLTLAYPLSKRNDFLSRLMDLIAPSEAYAASCKSCPNGFWGGAFTELPNVTTHPGGGSMVIATYYCTSDLSKMMFVRTLCGFLGPTTTFATVSTSVGLSGCWDACCGENFLRTSSGFIASMSYQGVKSTGRTLNFSGDTKCVNFGMGYELLSWNILEKANVSSVLTTFGGTFAYQWCKTEEFNIFDWMCSSWAKSYCEKWLL